MATQQEIQHFVNLLDEKKNIESAIISINAPHDALIISDASKSFSAPGPYEIIQTEKNNANLLILSALETRLNTIDNLLENSTITIPS